MFAPLPNNDDPVFESFPEYNNFPARWDLSELDAAESPAHHSHDEQSACLPAADGAGIDLPIPLNDAYPAFNHDPFPKLRTFPVYWDLSR